jgi:acyl-CoA thioesterase
VTEVQDPFSAATSVRSLGDGSYVANLHPDWAVGDNPHGGYLLALLTRAVSDGSGLEPLSISAQYLRPPRVGPVMIRLQALKTGKTVTVVRAALEQRGQVCVDATVTAGRMPAAEPEWSDLPSMPVNPPPDAIDLSQSTRFFHLAEVCDMRLDPNTAEFLNGGTGEPRYRMWVKPREGQPDLLFGLVAGDLTVPVTLNMGRFGWAPTVQLQVLVRALPAPGWCLVEARGGTLAGGWHDEDYAIWDSTGRLVAQSRQLARQPRG